MERTLLNRTALLLALLALIIAPARAAELNCMVNVQPPQITGVDQTIFNDMRQDIQDYMNETRFTEHKFEGHERIQCNISIILTALPAGDQFEGTMQVRSTRTALNSTYETVVFNFNDKQFRCNYNVNQQLQYSENNYTGNLTALLNFYAFMILGYDYDSYALNGGKEFFERAWQFVNLANSNSEPGWGAGDGSGRQNRYWLCENMRNSRYDLMHEIIYQYHREGLDIMHEDVNAGRMAVLESIEKLQELNNSNFNLYIVQVFLDAKANSQGGGLNPGFNPGGGFGGGGFGGGGFGGNQFQGGSGASSNEIVSIFRQAQTQDKQRLVQIMKQLDPANANAYKDLLKQEE